MPTISDLIAGITRQRTGAPEPASDRVRTARVALGLVGVPDPTEEMVGAVVLVLPLLVENTTIAMHEIVAAQLEAIADDPRGANRVAPVSVTLHTAADLFRELALAMAASPERVGRPANSAN